MKKAYFLPRALLVFAVFVVIGLGICRFSLHHYPNVADPEKADSREVLLYEGDTFHLAGRIGDAGMSSNKFPKNELLGEVTPKGIFDSTPPLLVWSVEGKENYLIVEDGEEIRWLYYRDGAINPAESETATAAP